MVNNLICPNCSAPLPANIRFCTECGAKIEENADKTDQNVSIENKPYTPNQNPVDGPITDPIESLKESGKDFMRDIGDFFNKVSESSRKRQRFCPKCSLISLIMQNSVLYAVI